MDEPNKLQVITFKFIGSEQEVENLMRVMLKISKGLNNKETVQITRR